MIDLQVQYGQCNMDNYIEYLICFCLNGSSVSQFFANVCLHVTFTIMCVNFILHIRITIDWQTIIINSGAYAGFLKGGGPSLKFL